MMRSGTCQPSGYPPSLSMLRFCCWSEMRVFSTDCGGLRRRLTARCLWPSHKTCSLADLEVQPQWTISKRFMLVASRQRLMSIGGYHRESSYPSHGICTMWPIYVDNLSYAALKTLGISCICMDYRRSCRLWIWSSFMADCFEMHDSWEDRKILFPWCDGRLGKLERQTH